MLFRSVHDTSQVAGAALVFAETFGLPRALEVATVTKLMRNLLMAAVIPLMTLYHARQGDQADRTGRRRAGLLQLLPLFIVGFLLMAVLRSLGDAGLAGGGQALGLLEAGAWHSTQTVAGAWAVNMLVLALAAVGLKTRFGVLKGLGIRPFVVGLGAAFAVGLVSFAIITLLGWLGVC